jgi:hypothetical protein
LERKPEPEVPVREIQPFDVTLTVSVSNDGDGIQSVFVPPRTHSDLRLPRQAAVVGASQRTVKNMNASLSRVVRWLALLVVSLLVCLMAGGCAVLDPNHGFSKGMGN